MYKNISEINTAICHALDLDPAKVAAIDIAMEPGNLPLVTVRYVQLVGEEFARTVERYRLVKDDEIAPTDAPFPPHDPDYPDVNPATGDERETTDGAATDGPWDGPDDDPLDAA